MEVGTQVWKIQNSLEHIWGHRRYVAARSRDPSLSSSLTAWWFYWRIKSLQSRSGPCVLAKASSQWTQAVTLTTSIAPLDPLGSAVCSACGLKNLNTFLSCITRFSRSRSSVTFASRSQSSKSRSCVLGRGRKLKIYIQQNSRKSKWENWGWSPFFDEAKPTTLDQTSMNLCHLQTLSCTPSPITGSCRKQMWWISARRANPP